MKSLLTHCVQNVPYYQKLFRKVGFDPYTFASLDDIKEIPILDKQTAIENWNDLIATNIPKRRMTLFNTGGSTGKPFAFYFDKAKSDIAESFFIKRNWRMMGYRYGDRIIQMRGRMLLQNSTEHFEKKKNILYLSSYKMSEKNTEKYIYRIREFKPEFLHVYPSTAFRLSCYMRNNQIPPFEGIKAVFSSSENLYDYQRESIEYALNARVFQHYGLAEHVALASECPYNNELHLIPEYGFNWLADLENCRPVQNENRGIIIGTSFYNYSMPLINYNTGDIATLSASQDCLCKKSYPILSKIEGRQQEFIVCKNETRVPLTAFIFGQHFHAFKNILSMQIIQRELGEITILIEKTNSYSSKDEQEVKRKMLESVDNTLKIKFDYETPIKRTESNKHIFFINQLSSQKSVES
jgi:phenylacetate-CoA ligase